MVQLILVIIAFLCIPVLIRFKFKLSYTLLIVACILGVISGIGILSFKDAVLNVFFEPLSRSTILAVVMVSILSGLMKNYNILDKVVESLTLVIHNKKSILMIIPAMIGILIVPGGALLSAPFINNLGDEMELTSVRRAAINLVFRHIAMFMLPYSSGLLIIAASMPDISIPKLILLNLIFVASMIIAGYFIYIKDIKAIDSSPRANLGRNILKLIVYTSPIYICVILNVITGQPFFITLFASIFIVYLLSNKTDFLKVAIKSFNFNSVLIVIAVLILKETILRMDDLLMVFNNMFLVSSNTFTMMVVFMISAMFFAYVTGHQSASIAILLPMISQLNVSIESLHIYVFLTYCSAFLGYFFSPLHLCQAFTVQYMGTTTNELYKGYKLFTPILVLVLMSAFLILV